jgi:hypothetical protein
MNYLFFNRTVLKVFSSIMLIGFFWSCGNQNIQEKTSAKVYFESVTVSEKLEDGYWIEAADFDNDGDVDLIGYGLTMGKITLYENPGKDQLGKGNTPWKKRIIKNLKDPVGMDHADIDGDGLLDIIICKEYGKTQKTCLKDGGKIVWLRNPGKDTTQWAEYPIGQTLAMHRLKIGKFTQNENLELLALPVVGDSGDVHTIIPVYFYQKPTSLLDSEQWPRTLIDSSFFEVIHDAFIVKNSELSDFDVALISSQQGISWLYYGRDQQWHIDNIAKGETSREDYEHTEDWFTGTNTADIGLLGQNKGSYIAALEPFHGGTVSVYHKDQSDTWQRHVLHKYGHIDSLGFGVGHFLIAEDMDNDGSEEFLVAFPEPPKGVLYVKPIDLEKNIFDTVRVSNVSAARITIADFNNDGKKDFATIGYNVPGYYEDENPRVMIFLNTME